MSLAEATNASVAPPSALHISAKGSSVRGRGCKIGRGLPLQQRKAYRNLARQTPRVQGLTFDHNQIRWISYWKNEQNKQVQKHFPVSRYGFLGARRLALEERNRIMGRPPDADEAAEAIANLKVDPSIPCFLEWNSPSQHDEVQAVEVEDEATCASAEAWQDEEGDSATEAHRSETNATAASPADLVSISPVLPPELSFSHLHGLEVEANVHGSAVPSTMVECRAARKRPSVGSVESSEHVHPNVHSVESGKTLEPPASFRTEGKRYAVGAAAEVFPRSCKIEEVNDEFLARTMTRATTAAPDSCVDRPFMATDRTTSSASAGFDETDLPPDGGLAPIISHEAHEGVSTDAQETTFKKPMPPALSPLAVAWEDKFMSCELSIDVSRSERLASVIRQPRRALPNELENSTPPVRDAIISGGYFSPRAASSDMGSPAQGLSRASTMREVFDFCDSRKDLCARLIHDLFQGVRSSGVHSPKSGSSSVFAGAGMIPADMRCREFLEREEALHSLAIEEAKGADQLEPYLEIFRHCLVAGLMPSQLSPGEMVAMVWTLRCRMLAPWGKANTLRSPEQQFGIDPEGPSPFRERQGMTHRLLTDATNIGGHLTLDLSATGAIGLESPTAAVGRTSGFIPPPSLFFGPAHAPSSPTAALYGGCFAKATEQEHYFAVL